MKREYVLVLKTDYVYSKEALEELKKELNEALVSVKVAKVLNVRENETVQFVELQSDE